MADRRKGALTTLAGIQVEAVESALAPLADLAALWSIGVHVVEMREVGGIFQIPEEAVAMAFDDRLVAVGACKPRRGEQGAGTKDGRAQRQPQITAIAGSREGGCADLTA